MSRILIVSQHFRTGGFETQIQSFCRYLSSRGDEIHLATHREGKIDPIARFLSGICLVDQWSPDGNSILAAASTLESYISDNKIDWVHLHPFESFYAGGLAASRVRVPYCVTLHGPASLTWFAGIPYRAFLISCLLPDAIRVFAVSPETANLVKSLAPKLLPVILPNGVDLNQYVIADKTVDGPWAIVGRLDDEKIPGIQEALRLLANARKKQLIRNIAVWGDGSGKTFLENWSKEILDAEGWLTFQGHTDCLHDELQKGWAGVLGMGRVVLEAGSMNLPIVLVGYDGVKGLVTLDNIDRLSICNFSGRGERNIDARSFEKLLSGLAKQEGRYQLRKWIENKVDNSNIWQQYKKLMSMGIRRKPKYSWANSFEALCRRLGKESIYSPQGVAQMLEDVVSSTGRKFASSDSLLIELFKVIEEKKLVDMELTRHQQALTQEKASGTERVSSLEQQLTTIRQEQEENLQKEATYRQSALEEKATLEERISELTTSLDSLRVERDQAIQAEAMVRQALSVEKAQWSNRIETLEREIALLNQKRDEALQRESAHYQMLQDERAEFEQRLHALEATISSLEEEWYQLIESEALLRQTWEKEKPIWQEEILNLKQEKTLLDQKLVETLDQLSNQQGVAQSLQQQRIALEGQILKLQEEKAKWQEDTLSLKQDKALSDQKLAETLRQLSTQEGTAQSLQQQRIALEGQILKLQEEREEILTSEAIRQQKANELRNSLLQLIQAIEEARQSQSWRMMRLLRRLRLQAIHGDLGEKIEFIKWTIRKILRIPPKPTDPSFDPLPENLLESLLHSPEKVSVIQGGGVQEDHLSKLILAVEVARQTLAWRIMRFLRRFREWVILGNLRNHWQFSRWFARKIAGRNEPPGTPSFDPIGDENFYDLASLQRAIKSARKIRSWKTMCFLRGIRNHLIHRDLKDIWDLRKLLGGPSFARKEGQGGWMSFDPIPEELMKPPPIVEVPALPVSKELQDQRPTYIFALDRGWGDILMSLPVAETLKKNNRAAKIIYFLESESHLPLLQNNPYIDEVYFSRDHFASHPDAKVFDIRHTPSDWHKSRIHITDMIASQFGVEVQTRRPSLYVPDHQASRKRFGLVDPYAVTHLQSTTKEKDWDLKNWPGIFKHLYRQYGLKTVLIGGPDEELFPENPYVIDLRGKTSLSETVNIVKWARLFVGIDSGPMHIAEALNIPAVVLWGNTSPIICGIHSDVVYNIEPERKCDKGGHWACHFFPCPEKELCVNHISASDVIRCVDDCLSPKKGGLIVHIGKDPWGADDRLKTTKYAFIQRDTFTARVLNEFLYSSHSEYVAILSSDSSDSRWNEIDRLAEIAEKKGLGIVSSQCLRYVGPGIYGECTDNAVTKCHRGSSGFLLVRRNVLTRIGGFDPKFKSLAGCLNDFYFKALLLNEPVWYVESSLPVSRLDGLESGDEEYLLKKWGDVDLARLQHLESVSFMNHRQRDTTLYLIFSHCSFDFNGGGQRWDSLTKLASRNGYHLLYVDELMKEGEADSIVKDFLEAQMPRRIVIWARPVPRYKKYFDLFRQQEISQIYDCIDDWADMMVQDPTVPFFEGEIFKQSAMVTTTALNLREKIRQTRNGETIPLIPNGADPEIFDYRRVLEVPSDLKKAPLTLGYFGTLAEWWIDDSLLCDLAKELEGRGAINLIGPCKQEYQETFSKFENIAVLGQKRHDELPPYLSHFDVALIPFKVIPVTESTSPVKAYEYLFGGKPIVSTDLPEVRHLPYTYCSKTHEDFLNNVLKASRIQINAAELDVFRTLNSWDSRLQELLIHIDLASPSRKSIDVVIVSYNTRALTEACIRSIERHTRDFRLIVVDNHSTDGSTQMLEEFRRQGRLLLIRNQRNEGYSRAVNAGVNKGTSEFVAILNSDIEVLSNWTEPLIEALDSDRRVAAVAPKLIEPNGGIDCAGVWGTNANPLIRFAEKNEFGKFNRILENVYISGACIATRRQTFYELGGLDERYFFYFEDMDFCFEARYRGYKILYLPNTVIVHHRAKASASNQEQTQKWYVQSQQLFMEKWKDRLVDDVEYPRE